MQIKYLKDAPLGKKGDIATVNPMQANILIKLKIAKAYTPRKRKSDDDDSIDNSADDSVDNEND